MASITASFMTDAVHRARKRDANIDAEHRLELSDIELETPLGIRL